jgi:hypothetical protein
MKKCLICQNDTINNRNFCSKECLDKFRYNKKLEKYKGLDIIFVQHKSKNGKTQNVVKIKHNCPICGKDKGYGFISALKRNCNTCSSKLIENREISHNFYGQRKRIIHSSNEYITRSTFESFFIEHLIRNNINFLYESKTFKFKDNSTYLPDFYLLDTDEYIELKGLMREKDKNKIDKFKEEFPDKKLKVLLKSDLEKLGYNLHDYKKAFSFKIKGIDWRMILITNNNFIKRFGEGQGLTDFNNKKVYFNESYVTDKVILHELGHVFYSSCCTDSVTSLSNDDIVEIFCDIIGEHGNELFIQCSRLIRLFYDSMKNRYGEDFKKYKLYTINKNPLKEALTILNKESKKSRLLNKELTYLNNKELIPMGLTYE